MLNTSQEAHLWLATGLYEYLLFRKHFSYHDGMRHDASKVILDSHNASTASNLMPCRPPRVCIIAYAHLKPFENVGPRSEPECYYEQVARDAAISLGTIWTRNVKGNCGKRIHYWARDLYQFVGMRYPLQFLVIPLPLPAKEGEDFYATKQDNFIAFNIWTAEQENR